MDPRREPFAEPLAGHLAEPDVHVWLTRPEDITDPALLDAYENLLSDSERERRQRFRFERDRHTYLVTRALARTVLSSHSDVAPKDWVFEIGDHGKPEIAPEFESRLRFNLSHTRGMVACAVTLDRDVGVDVETVDRRTETTKIADRFFSPSEVEDLFALPPEQQRERFFTYWALKESYIKARGLGLAIPLGSFSFHVRGDAPIGISFDASLGDDPTAWQFRHEWATEVHSLAVGVVRTGADMEITIRETVPVV